MGVEQEIDKAISHIETARKTYKIDGNDKLGMFLVYNEIVNSYEEAIDILEELKKEAIKKRTSYMVHNNKTKKTKRSINYNSYFNNTNNENNHKKKKTKRSINYNSYFNNTNNEKNKKK
jgi:hypothetical protein